MSAKPWIKFSPEKWRSDAALRTCSLAARGLWIEMIGLMHESPRYGHLVVGGRILDDAALAALIGASTHEVSELLGHLEQAGVFTRSSDGAIYCRKMVREFKRSNVNRKNVKKRWNGDNTQPPDIPKENGCRNTNRNTRKSRDSIFPPKGEKNTIALQNPEICGSESLKSGFVCEFGRQAFDVWLADAVVDGCRLIAANGFKQNWIRDNYAQTLRQYGITEIATVN